MTTHERWGLVVVDMQNDFIAAEGYYARRTQLDAQVARGSLTTSARDRLLADVTSDPPGAFTCRAASLLPVVDNVCQAVAHARSRQWPVAYLKAVYGREFPVQPPSLRRDPQRRHYPCKPDSWGAALIEPIETLVSARSPVSVETVIEKHTLDAFHQTDLPGFLEDCGVHGVMVVGVETHVCVLATATRAAVTRFETTIVEDCVWTARQELGLSALAIFRDAFGSTTRLGTLPDSGNR